MLLHFTIIALKINKKSYLIIYTQSKNIRKMSKVYGYDDVKNHT